MRANPKGGRPPKPARLRRTQRLQLLLTVSERKALNEFARQRNLTASEIVRGCLQSLLEDSTKKDGRQ
jgi:hypothetical protein